MIARRGAIVPRPPSALLDKIIGTATGANQGSYTVTIPGSVIAGDLLVLSVGVYDGTCPTPAGFSLYKTSVVGYGHSYIFTKTAGGSDHGTNITVAATWHSSAVLCALRDLSISTDSNIITCTSSSVPTYASDVDADKLQLVLIWSWSQTPLRTYYSPGSGNNTVEATGGGPNYAVTLGTFFPAQSCASAWAEHVPGGASADGFIETIALT